jgi:LemA protein
VTAEQAAAKSPGDPAAMAELSRAEGVLGGVLGRLFALSEAYPDLKASETMNQLMEELTSTENRVSFARQAYNDAVTAYNTKRETVPTNLIANSFGFKEAQLFEIVEEAQREAPKVSFT